MDIIIIIKIHSVTMGKYFMEAHTLEEEAIVCDIK